MLAFARGVLGLAGVPLAIVVMMAALPVGSNALIFAQRYESLQGETSTAIVVSTLASSPARRSGWHCFTRRLIEARRIAVPACHWRYSRLLQRARQLNVARPVVGTHQGVGAERTARDRRGAPDGDADPPAATAPTPAMPSPAAPIAAAAPVEVLVEEPLASRNVRFFAGWSASPRRSAPRRPQRSSSSRCSSSSTEVIASESQRAGLLPRAPHVVPQL